MSKLLLLRKYKVELPIYCDETSNTSCKHIWFFVYKEKEQSTTKEEIE